MDSTLTLLLGILLLGSFDVSLCQRRRVRGGSGGVEFDCPEEFGYYPHPTDCTQYYVCVFGGALLESCTGGLMYSHELQTCDWPRNVGCGGSSDHASLSTVRVTDPRTRGDARSSTRPVTVTIPSRDQDHQRRQQEDFVKKQYPLYAEDSRVTPESAAEEDEGPEGGERQQRVYRGQPAGLGAAPRERDSLRHTGAVTNTIPASAISGVRGDKGVTYTLVQQSAQPQQQQLYSLIYTNDIEDSPGNLTYYNDQKYDVYVFSEFNLLDAVGNKRLDQPRALRTKRQIAYRFPTGGHLVTAPRPSSYPLQWPPVSPSVTTLPLAYSPKLPPNRPVPPSSSPSQRPPPSAPPPRPTLDPPLPSSVPPRPVLRYPPSSHRSLGEFLGLTGVEVSSGGARDKGSPSQQTDYRSPTTLSPDYRPTQVTVSPLQIYQNQSPIAGAQGDQGVRTASRPSSENNRQQPSRLQYPQQYQQRPQFPPSTSNTGFLGDSRDPVKAHDDRSVGRQEGLNDGIRQGNYYRQEARNNDEFIDFRNVKEQQGDIHISPTQVSRLSGHPVRIHIPIPNVNSAPTKPINFARPQVTLKPLLPPQKNFAVNQEPDPSFPDVLSQTAPLDTPSPVMRPPVYDSPSPLPEITTKVHVTPSYPQLPLSPRHPNPNNRQIVPPNTASFHSQSSNANIANPPKQFSQVQNSHRKTPQHSVDHSRVEEATLVRPHVHLPKEKDSSKNEHPLYPAAQVPSTSNKDAKATLASKGDKQEDSEYDRDNDDRYDDEEEYEDEYEDEEDSREEEDKQRKPNPFYGEHRFGPLLNNPSEDENKSSFKPSKTITDFSQSNFDFDAYLDKLREEVGFKGHSQEKPLLQATTSTQAPRTKKIDSKYLDNPFLAPILRSHLGDSDQQDNKNGVVATTEKIIPEPKSVLQEPFKPKESDSSSARHVGHKPGSFNQEQSQRTKESTVRPSTEKNIQGLYNRNPSPVKGHYILRDSPALPNQGGIKPTLIRIPVAISRPTSAPKKNLVEVTTQHDVYELEEEEYDEYTEETSSPLLPTESVPYRSGNHIGEGKKLWRIPLTSTETLLRKPEKAIATTTSRTTSTTTTTTSRPYAPSTRKSPIPSTTPKSASLGGSNFSPRPTRPTRPPTPYRPTQRSRLRTTTSTPPKDQLDSKDEGVDSAKGNTRYVADAGHQSRTQGKARPVDASGYSDVEVSIESRPVQAQRARLVSTPATYNATTTTIYSSSAAPPVAQQYNANYYALYDEDEVELYRDVDYSQVSGGRQTNAGNDNYRGQTNYKVQQVQQPEVVQQQSYIGRGNTNSYLSSQQQPQQTYVQQDVQPEISYGGAALDSPDYNDNYNSAEDNGGIQYNQAPQQQRTSVNRNRQRGKASAGTAIRDEADRAPSSSYSSPAITRQSPTTTTSTTTTTTTTYSTPTDSSSPRRGASSRDGTAYIRAEPASPRRGYPTQRPIQQARRNPPQPQTVEAVESDSLPSRLSAAYPISSSSDSSDQPLSQNSIEPFDYVNPSRARGSFNREPSYTYSNTSDSTVGQRFKSTSVLPKEKPHVRIRPTTASPESQSTTGSPSRGSSSSRTQGRGSSPYSSSSVSGRSRPTLKPSTSIVSKASEYIDVYRFPPSRPEPVYPQPRVDQAAAKCRKDICLLPDCNCGGKDIPGGLEPQNVPQIVLLTFDDSVNDLNKQLYSDLFEKGRKNPNGCPISATFYVSHEWTDYSQVQNLYAAGHEMASHSISHSFGEQFSQRKWSREINGQREILAAYGGVKLEDIRGMRAPFLAVGGNKMFKMLYDTNFTYDSSMPVYENRPPSWPYTFDYKVFHDCMIPPCPTRSYPGVWEVPMVMWQDLNGGRCSMGDACSNPPTSDGVYKMLIKNFERHYTTNRAPFGLYYHAAWFTQPHHKEGFEAFLDTIVAMDDVWLVTNWQAIQWVRDPTPLSHVKQFQPFDCNYPDRPRKCNNPKVCNLWHKSGVRYMRTCQPCPDVYPWTGKTGVKNSRVDNEVED